MNWEYGATRATDLDRLLEVLNEQGASGWELVSVNYVSDTVQTGVVGPGGGQIQVPSAPAWVAVLKRPKSA
jgi:hypothetical protein